MIQFFKSKSIRTKNLIFGSSSLVVSRIGCALLAFVTTGILARYFTSEEFGLWALLITMPGLFSGFDLGFSNSLKNKLSQLFAHKNDKEDKIYFFSVFYGLIFFIIILLPLILIFKQFIPWPLLFNTTQQNINSMGTLLFNTNLFIIVISIPFSIALSAGYFSYQESYLNSLFSFLVPLLTLSLVYILIHYRSSFVSIALLFVFIGLFIYILSFFIFLIKRKWTFIKISFNSLIEKIRELLGSSVQFVLLQIFAGIFFSVDTFVVSKISGIGFAGDYFLVKKICLLVIGMHMSALIAVWPSYTEALEKKDIVWIKKILNYFFIITFIAFLIFIILLYFFGAKFIFLWTGKEINLKVLFLLLGVWSLLFGIGNCFSVFLNSFNNLKLQLLWNGLACIAVIPLSILLGTKYGITGICWAQVVLVFPIAISDTIQSFIVLKRFSQRT